MPDRHAIVTNIGGDGWYVVETTTVRHGPFGSREEAEGCPVRADAVEDHKTSDAVRSDPCGTSVEWPDRQPMIPAGRGTPHAQPGRDRQSEPVEDRFADWTDEELAVIHGDAAETAARIREAEARREKLERDLGICREDRAFKHRQAMAAEARCEALTAALEWYANPRNWTDDGVAGRLDPEPDGGDRAREALSGAGSPPEDQP